MRPEIVLGAALVLLAVGACRDERAPTTGTRTVGGVLAFVGTGDDDPLWRVLYASARRELRFQSGLEFKAAATLAAGAAAQEQLIKDMYSPQLRGLCVYPVDGPALRQTLEDLQTRGITVVTVLRTVPSARRFPHAGIDEQAVGRALAEAVHAALHGSGSIAVLQGDGGLPELTGRRVGFRERIDELATLNVLRWLDCGNNAQHAQRQMAEYTERFPRLSAWVALDDWPLRHHDARRRLLPESCTLVTYGVPPEYWPYLTNGTCSALVGARYDSVAEQAVQMCLEGIRGELSATQTYLAPPITITAGNLDEFRLRWFKWRELPVPARATTRPAPARTTPGPT